MWQMVQQIAAEAISICSGYFLDIPLPDTRAIITFSTNPLVPFLEITPSQCFKQVAFAISHLFCYKKLMNYNGELLEWHHQRRWTRYSATQTSAYALFPIQVYACDIFFNILCQLSIMLVNHWALVWKLQKFSRTHWLIVIVNKWTDNKEIIYVMHNLCNA